VNSDVVNFYISKNTKKTKTSRKTQRNNNLLKTKRVLNIKMSAKGGPVLDLACQGAICLPATLQARHWSHSQSHTIMDISNLRKPCCRFTPAAFHTVWNNVSYSY